MIKLSDVKIRPQYRTCVRHRLIVLEYAWAHGPAAAPPGGYAEGALMKQAVASAPRGL
jgi:hypothetical protein